ncbi:MAG: hypothetical protein WBP85_07530 [Terracidiphilus sp.]
MHSKTLFATVTIAFAVGCYTAPRSLRAQASNPQPSNNSTPASSDNTAQPPTVNTAPQSDAAAPSESGNADMSQATTEASQMVPAQALLAQNIDTKNMQPGEQFKAVLKGKIHLKNGEELPRGTTLVGTVANETVPQGAKSELALRFTQADLKSGKTIPIEATIVGVTPPATQDVAPAEMMYNAPPDSWDGSTLTFDVTNALSGIDLHSRIAGQNSGDFVSTKSNLKLGARTQISLAIGAQGTNGPNGGY